MKFMFLDKFNVNLASVKLPLDVFAILRYNEMR